MLDQPSPFSDESRLLWRVIEDLNEGFATLSTRTTWKAALSIFEKGLLAGKNVRESGGRHYAYLNPFISTDKRTTAPGHQARGLASLPAPAVRHQAALGQSGRAVRVTYDLDDQQPAHR